jgi:hypothetical protein
MPRAQRGVVDLRGHVLAAAVDGHGARDAVHEHDLANAHAEPVPMRQPPSVSHGVGSVAVDRRHPRCGSRSAERERREHGREVAWRPTEASSSAKCSARNSVCVAPAAKRGCASTSSR